MADVWIFNGTAKTLDLTSSFYDVMTQRGALVPPGSQGHFTVDAQSDLDAVLAHLNRYGAVPHASVASPATFAGVSHSTSAPVGISGRAIPVVQVPPPAKPPKPAPAPAKK